MSSLFYARYVPPSSGGNTVANFQSGRTESRKRRKIDSGATNIAEAENFEHSTEIAFDSLEGVQGEKKKKKKSNPKRIKEKAQSKRQPELTADSEGALTTITSENAVIDNVVSDGLHEKSPTEDNSKFKEKKKRQENLPVEAPSVTTEPSPNDDSALREKSPWIEDIKHKKIQAKREKSALLAKRESDSNPVSQSSLEANDETAPPIEAHGLVPIPQPQQDPENRIKASAVPDWLAHPTIARFSDTVSLDALRLHPTTLGSLKQKGYQDAFAVQATVVPLLLPGPNQYPGDLCISAATGSGKTLAYALPLIENLRDRPITKLRGLVVVPTRELVAQAREYLEICASGSKLQIATAVGSKSIKDEYDQLIKQGQRYDPEAYQAEQENESDEEEDLMNWDFEDPDHTRNGITCFTNHVVEYTSKVDILICTPGRLVDHMRSSRGFTLDHVQWLVIDEADRLLDESFQEWIEVIMPALTYQAPLDPIEQQLQNTFHLVRERQVRKIVLSATMTKDIGKITALQLRRPKMISLESNQETRNTGDALVEKSDAVSERDIQLPSTLVEIAIPIANAEEKPLHLIHLLESDNEMTKSLVNHSKKTRYRPDFNDTKRSSSPSSDEDSDSDSSSSTSSSSTSTSTSASSSNHPLPPTPPNPTPPSHSTLIFSTNNETALRLARLLTLLRPSWTPLIHTLTKTSTSASTRKTLSSFRAHQGSILIASDRASRGLDLPNLTHVINYDMPPSVTAYVHRVGRTARAGRKGLATTLVAHHEARWFWNEIARGKAIGRGKGRKVQRRGELKRGVGMFTDEERGAYEEALRVLGREARGETA